MSQHFGELFLYRLTYGLLKDKIFNCIFQTLFWKLKTENKIKKRINHNIGQFYDTGTWVNIYYKTKEPLAYSDSLSYAAKYGFNEVLETLLLKYDPTGNHNILEKAAENENMHKVIEIILADGRLSIDANNQSALNYAIQYGRTKAVKSLVNNSGDLILLITK